MRQLASAACLVCAVSSVAVAGDPPRFPQQGFGAQILPNLLAADLDHDGALDVAGSGKSLALFYGSGDGRFLLGAPPPGLTASDPYEPFVYVGAVAVADVDGDGLSELVASSSGYVPYQHALLTIDVDASRNATVVATAGCGSLSDLVVADFDGDGRPDLAACSGQYTSGIQQLELYLGGAAGFLLAGGTDGLDLTTLRIAAGDLDGDGLPDVVTSGNEIQVWRSLGAVGFAAPVAANAQPESYSLAIADLDLDGDLDLLRGGVNQSDYPLGASLNPGDGDFSAAAQAIDGTALEFGVDVADLDADGVPDFVESVPTGIVWGIGQGDGSFATSSGPGSSFPQFNIVAGDFDGDGHTDVLHGGGLGSVALELVRGTPGGGFAFNGTSPGSGPLIATLDADGDGQPDALTLLALGSGQFLASVHQGSADGSFTAAWSLAISANSPHLYVADFAEDGYDDVVLQKGLLLSLYAGGAGGLSTAAPTSQVIATPDAGAVGDIDLDGRLDLVLSGAASAFQPGVRVYLGDGAGSFALSAAAPAPVFKSESILLGDVDGDGAPDVAASTSNLIKHVLHNIGGSLHEDHVQPLPQFGSALGDVNGDGFADLLGKSVFVGDGAFGFSGIGVGLAGQDPPTLTDLDGDGSVDLVSRTSSVIAVLHNLGDAHFETSVVFAGGAVDGAAVADVDHDGRLDLVASAKDVLSGERRLAVAFQQPVPAWSKLGHGKPGASHVVATLEGSGTLQPDSPVTLALHDATPGAATLLLAGLEQQDLPFKGGVLVPSVDIALALVADAEGGWRLTSRWPAAVPAGLDLYLQAWIADARVSHGQAASQGLRAHAP